MASDKNFFQQLNTKKISDIPSSDIQLLSNPINLESGNKEVLSSIKLVNDASMRDGRHIPATSEIATGTPAESGVKVDVKTPARGEVWEIDTASMESLTGGSGDAGFSFFVTQGSVLPCVESR